MQHGNFPITNTFKDSKEQTTGRTQNLSQKSEVIKKRPPKVKLIKNDKLDKMREDVLQHHSATFQGNLNIPDRLNMNNVEQSCIDFVNNSMSDETLLHFGCSQYSGTIDRVTQALDTIAILSNNEKFIEVNLSKEQNGLSDLKSFESLNVLDLNSTKNKTQMISSGTTASTNIFEIQNDNAQKDDKKSFLNSKLKKSSVIQVSEPLSITECVMSQQTTLGRIMEEEGTVVNSDENIENGSIFDRSEDLFDNTFCSSISSQSFNTAQNSSYCMKRISRRCSINQSPRSPSFQSPLHKMLKFGSPFERSVQKETKFNESMRNDIQHFDNNRPATTEFQIIDVCRCIYLFGKNLDLQFQEEIDRSYPENYLI